MKFTSTSGRDRMFATVPGDRMLPNAIRGSSTTTKMAFGDTAGVPSSFVVATAPARQGRVDDNHACPAPVEQRTGAAGLPREQSSATVKGRRTCGSVA